MFLYSIIFVSDIDRAIWQKDPQKLQKLLNKYDKKTETETLHKIASNSGIQDDDVIMIDIFLEQGTDVNSLNKNGFTPLDMCLNKKVALYLRKNRGKHWYELIQRKNENEKSFE